MERKLKKHYQNLDTHQLLIKTFEFYYQQLYKDSGYRLNIAANEKLIQNFFKLLLKRGYPEYSLGSDFINSYFSFQIEYWREKEIKRRPTLNWFIGEKAVNRFFDVKDWSTQSYFVTLNTQDIKPYEATTQDNEYETQLKKKHHNKEQGFVFCVENTSLYSTSPTCLSCRFKEDCKKLLKENYPLLWRKRLKS
jgi:hypothetical protein